jgi:hypothetical protein
MRMFLCIGLCIMDFMPSVDSAAMAMDGAAIAIDKAAAKMQKIVFMVSPSVEYASRMNRRAPHLQSNIDLISGRHLS